MPLTKQQTMVHHILPITLLFAMVTCSLAQAPLAKPVEAKSEQKDNASHPSSSKPLFEQDALFTAGELDYKMFRIPGIVVTSQGSVLVYCEARRNSGSDWDKIDVMLRRSTDGGKSFSPLQHIAHLGEDVPKNPIAMRREPNAKLGQTVNNPVAIASRNGTIHFLYCVEYARCFYMRSTDDGISWSKPVEITDTFEPFRKEYDWKVLATGPGHGIQLKNGRLLVPVWLSLGTLGNGHRPSVMGSIFSDDDGTTWKPGSIAINNTPEFTLPNETCAVELADGRVMLNVRNESKENRRLITTSPNGATDWSKPVFHDELVEPICMASMVRLSLAENSDRNRLLFCNPNTLEPAAGQKAVAGKGRVRKNVSVKLSYDEGQTWPVTKTIEPDFSGYSDLAIGPDGTIYCFYESKSTNGNIYHTGRLMLARFNLAWLTDGRDSWPVAKSTTSH